MSLTIVLSGPRASEPQVRTALAGVGLDVHPAGHDHGLPALASGEDSPEPQGFVTALGHDINEAVATARPLGWALRMHFDTPEPAKPSAEQVLMEKIAALEARLAQLETR